MLGIVITLCLLSSMIFFLMFIGNPRWLGIIYWIQNSTWRVIGWSSFFFGEHRKSKLAYTTGHCLTIGIKKWIKIFFS
jgi:hypothetical protein